MHTEREVDGVGDRFSCMQPSSQTCVARIFLGKRLYVCVVYDMNEGITDLWWYQGEVISF